VVLPEPAHPPQLKPSVDQIVVDKRAHRMQLLRHGVVVKTYQVALGRGGMGNKSRQGDNRVPEGAYRIAGRNPHSAFHLSLHIGYPTQEQARAAAAAGIDPGGDVMIHGLRRGWAGWAHGRTASTGRAAASPSPMVRSKRSGPWCQTAPPS
jgi:murein L,D-transpeptidase YafK